jgi:hypothetical protein
MRCGPMSVTRAKRGLPGKRDGWELLALYVSCTLIEHDTRLRVGRGIAKTETKGSVSPSPDNAERP